VAVSPERAMTIDPGRKALANEREGDVPNKSSTVHPNAWTVPPTRPQNGQAYRPGEFFAYLNHCPHMGGPACQGRMIAKVEEIVADDRTSKGMTFSKTKMHIVCPWHGFEFDIRTGAHPGNPRAKLRRVKVTVSGGDVIVTAPDERESVPVMRETDITATP
jgi:nitrite reductase/ring-hydroxylating ferredoxin subunit